MASNKTSNQTCENQDDNQWPRFLIMEAADQNVPLNLNAFVLKKAIDGMANAQLDNVKPMKSGRVFIEVETKQQCKNILKTTRLLGYLPVKVSQHRALNSSKFVIKCEELDTMEEDEIKKELQPQGIIAVKRISIFLCHPSIYMDVACKISSDRLGSDHHPITITANTSDHPVPERVSKLNFKKAKWDAFQDQCITEITPDLFNGAEDKMAIFSSTFLDIAADNIHKTSLVTPYGDMDVGQHWPRLWLVAYRRQAITETNVDNHGILHRCGSKDNHQLHLQKSIL